MNKIKITVTSTVQAAMLSETFDDLNPLNADAITARENLMILQFRKLYPSVPTNTIRVNTTNHS